MNISKFQKRCHLIAKEKGWWRDKDRNFGEVIALCHSELSEALEEYRIGKNFNEIYTDGVSEKPEGIPVELADCIIRILDFMSFHKVDMEKVLKDKLKYNTARTYRHGNKRA